MDRLTPKKRLGQHFLANAGVADKIVALLPPAPAGTQCLEIGPGEGVLTQRLLQAAPLTAVEVDPDAATHLQARFRASSESGLRLRTAADSLPERCRGQNEEGPAPPEGKEHPLTLWQQDVLSLKLPQGDWQLIGNLPYNISSPILFWLLDYRVQIPVAVFMLQKEVAKRIAAGPGSKEYGILSVLLGAYYELKYAFTVAPGSFRPPPKVDSGVITLTRRTEAPTVPYPRLKRLVKAAFNQRRKTLGNALKGLPVDFPEGWAGKRAEQLSVAEFIELAERSPEV